MRHGMLPQATGRMLPPLGELVISTIKNSSIFSVISIQELTLKGMGVMWATYLAFEAWMAISLALFPAHLFSIPVWSTSGRVHKKERCLMWVSRFRRGRPSNRGKRAPLERLPGRPDGFFYH